MRANHRPHLLAALLLLIASNVAAAPGSSLPGRFKVNPLHLEGGTSRAQVNAVQRDATGYLWVGTDNGLMRYDGYNYTVFNNNPADPGSLGSNLVLTLLLDSTNTLWVGTNKLSVFNADTETFDNYPLTDGNAIWGMAMDPDGILWVSAERTRLVGFDTRKREMVYHALYKPAGNAAQVPDNISDIINDRSDPSILWMTAAGAGL